MQKCTNSSALAMEFPHMEVLHWDISFIYFLHILYILYFFYKAISLEFIAADLPTFENCLV